MNYTIDYNTDGSEASVYYPRFYSEKSPSLEEMAGSHFHFEFDKPANHCKISFIGEIEGRWICVWKAEFKFTPIGLVTEYENQKPICTRFADENDLKKHITLTSFDKDFLINAFMDMYEEARESEVLVVSEYSQTKDMLYEEIDKFKPLHIHNLNSYLNEFFHTMEYENSWVSEERFDIVLERLRSICFIKLEKRNQEFMRRSEHALCLRLYRY